MSGILPINTSYSPDRIADIIFVHGLNDNAMQCWKPQDWSGLQWWPHWVAADFRNTGVWLADYESPISNWQGTAMTLPERARNLLEWISARPELEGGKRPLIFVAHSLGGLVVKQMLQMAITLRNASYEPIGKQIRAIVFLSTPHLGAQLSTLAQNLDRLGIARLSTAMKTLTDDDPHLRELNYWYRDNCQPLGIQTRVFAEARPLRLQTRGILGFGGSVTTLVAVDQKTADPGLAGVQPVSLDEDHLTMCKPASKDALVVISVSKFLREVLSKVESERAASSQGAPAPDATQTIGGDAAPVGSTPAPAVQTPPVNAGPRRELIAAMLKLPQIIDSARRTAIVRELSPISVNVPNSATPADHVTAIVDTCLEQKGGLESLRGALRFYYSNAIAFDAVEAAISRLQSGDNGRQSVGATAAETAGGAARPAGPMGAAQRIKCEHLKQRKAILEKQYSALLDDLKTTLGPDLKVTLNARAEQIATDLTQVEADIQANCV